MLKQAETKMSDKNVHNCVLCNSKLGSKQELQEHFRKHANKEINDRGEALPKKKETPSVKCDICDRAFDTVAATIRHRFKMHPNSPTKYFCPYCGKQFPLRTHRDKHLDTHDPKEKGKTENHKMCEECQITFFNQKALDYHQRSIHKRLARLFQPIATPPPSNKIKVNSMNDALSVYYCHLCGAEYVIKFNLQQHLEKFHTNKEREAVPEDWIKCTVCSAYFFSKKAYEVHNTYHQPEDLYVTSEQQRLRTVTKVDQDFDIRRVETLAEKYIPKDTYSKRRVKNWTKKDVSHKKLKSEEKNEEDFTSSGDDTSNSDDADTTINTDSDVPS